MNKQENYILFDLKLPKIIGYEVLKEIKSNHKKKNAGSNSNIIPGKRGYYNIIKGYDLGVNSYVRKPVDYQYFVSVVNNLGVSWLAINKNIQ